jgi:hypothetical protein
MLMLILMMMPMLLSWVVASHQLSASASINYYK